MGLESQSRTDHSSMLLPPPAETSDMSELQRKWAKAKINAMAGVQESDKDGETDDISELPEFPDDDSSSASSASSTGTIIPSPSQKLFARPQG